MHIPDGVLDPITAVSLYLVVLTYAAFIFIHIKNKGVLSEQSLSTLSSLTALVFVAQMVSWPIPGGTSLHMVGAGLVGAILGPSLGFVSMMLVLIIQCFVFGDGGISALGANALNMAIIGVLSGYVVYKGFRKLLSKSGYNIFLAGFMAGWLSLTLSGFACGVEIGISQYFGLNLSVTVPIMFTWHLVLGIVEGILTGLILRYLVSRSTIFDITQRNLGFHNLSMFNASIILTLIISPIFSIYLADLLGYKEPLDLILETLGYRGGESLINTPFLDYTVPYLPQALGYVVSGVIGLIILFSIFTIFRFAIGRGNKE